MARRQDTDRAFQHATARAEERYGVRLTRFDYRVLEQQIGSRDSRRARLIQKLRDGVEVWLVLHGTTWLDAVYQNGRIVTFLPRGQQFTDDGRKVW